MRDSRKKVEFSPSELSKKEHGALLCYPGTNLESFESRVDQLRELGVLKIILEGNSKVGKYGIVGRGCVSTVVKARLKSQEELVALKNQKGGREQGGHEAGFRTAAVCKFVRRRAPSNLVLKGSFRHGVTSTP